MFSNCGLLVWLNRACQCGELVAGDVIWFVHFIRICVWICTYLYLCLYLHLYLYPVEQSILVWWSYASICVSSVYSCICNFVCIRICILIVYVYVFVSVFGSIFICYVSVFVSVLISVIVSGWREPVSVVNLWQEMSFGFASVQLWPKSKHSVILSNCKMFLSKLQNVFVNNLSWLRCPAAPTCICLAFLKVIEYHLWPTLTIEMCPHFKKNFL